MSVVGRSIGDTRRVEAVQPVANFSLSTGLPSGSGATSDGSQPISGANGTSAASTANPVPVRGAFYNFLGYQQITGATLLTSQALTVPANATVAILQNNTTQIIRVRPDGATTAPTTTTGQRIAIAGVLTLDIGNASLTATRMIAEAAATGTFDVTYYN